MCPRSRPVIALSLFAATVAAGLPNVLAPRATAAHELPRGLVEYRPLTWADFRADDRARAESREAAALTVTVLAYKYGMRIVDDRRGNATATISSVAWSGGFDPARSWRRSRVKPDDTRLLRHEQGHFDLNEWKLREARSLPLPAYPTGTGRDQHEAKRDLERKMSALYQRHRDELRAVQDRYDAETRNGLEAERQAVWSARFDAALAASVPPPLASLVPRQD